VSSGRVLSQYLLAQCHVEAVGEQLQQALEALQQLHTQVLVVGEVKQHRPQTRCEN